MPLDLLLIHPPVVRPSEPPLGVATLAGFLRDQNLTVEILDLNAEVLHDLLNSENSPPAQDPFSRRALKQLPAALQALRSSHILHYPARYWTCVKQLDRILWLRSDMGRGPRVSLTDFRHPRLSPLRTRDLHHIAVTRNSGCLQAPMESRIAQVIQERRPRWVGISINYLSQALPAMALAGQLRCAFPELPIVAGGSLITAWNHRITRDAYLSSFVDEWICGAGEIGLARLLGKRVRERWGARPPSFEGINWSVYLSPERILPLATARGCYWARCLFCPEAILGRSFEAARRENLIRMIETAMAQNEVHWIHFTDNALSPSTLRRLSKMRTEALWFGFARFESVLKDPKLVRGLYRSGCRMLELGLESGSQRVLDAMGKGIRLDEVSRILEVLHHEGIGTYVYVMFGIPGESQQEAKRTLHFVASHARWIDYLSCSIMNLPHEAQGLKGLQTFPFPGDGEDLSLYTDFRSTDGMDRKEARRFLEKDFRRHPDIAMLLKRTPPVFSSNHAALFFNARHAPVELETNASIRP